MPRRNRCVVAGIPYHVTQRGVDRCEVFLDDEDRRTYISLLRQHLDPEHARLLGWCLMSNHQHLVILPLKADALAISLSRIHGRYAQYSNARWAHSGHLWQNRFFSCALGPIHLWRALAYVERNPVRARMVESAADYRWSSARAHINGQDLDHLLEMEWWERAGPAEWAAVLGQSEMGADELRSCTYASRPFGDERFVEEMRERTGRQWRPGRPKKKAPNQAKAEDEQQQLTLFR